MLEISDSGDVKIFVRFFKTNSGKTKILIIGDNGSEPQMKWWIDDFFNWYICVGILFADIHSSDKSISIIESFSGGKIEREMRFSVPWDIGSGVSDGESARNVMEFWERDFQVELCSGSR